jgi:myo-inositol-1(or 4)-monophosphatase
VADTDALVAAAIAAAEAAGAAIRPHFRSGLAADLKSDQSPVTLADRAAEQAMRAVLAERFPDHGILGEEFGDEGADRRFRWVLDPIDGTRAFITGRPVFGTLVALLDGDAPVLGLIDQPVTGERWLGVAGQPTRFTGPFGGAAGCRACARIGEAELSATTPDMFRGDEIAGWQRLAGAVRRVSWGGDCYAYGLLALGQIDIIAESSLRLWDWAALVPVIAGAGGRVTDWRGNPPSPTGSTQIVAVGDPALLETAIGLLTS